MGLLSSIFKPKILIRQYASHRMYQLDANRLAKKGYIIKNSTDGKDTYSLTKGCGCGACIGPCGLVLGRGKARITATYELQETQSTLN